MSLKRRGADLNAEGIASTISRYVEEIVSSSFQHPYKCNEVDVLKAWQLLDRKKGYQRPTSDWGRRARTGLAAFSMTIYTALPPLLLPLPSSSFPNSLLVVPGVLTQS